MKANQERKMVQVPISKLIERPDNPRTHSVKQVEQIAQSMKEFGWTNPILADENNGIIAGHGRLQAAKRAGYTEVPVIYLHGLTPAQVSALVIADNKLAENAGWDDRLLGEQLVALAEESFDLSVIGFDQKELDKLMRPILDEQSGRVFQSEEDAVPEKPSNPVTEPGDIWVMGKHRLICGSALDPVALQSVLQNQLADMVFTDPPYNVAYKGGSLKRTDIKNDKMKAFDEFLLLAMQNLMAMNKGAFYIAMSCRELDTLARAFAEAGGHRSTFIMWAKNQPSNGWSDYKSQYEPMLYGWKQGNQHFWCGDRDQTDVWFIDRPHKSELHPTMKPVALVERAIRNSSKTGDNILDTFGGSGTTLIAAEKSGRTGYLVELDPAYCDVIATRWEGFTGQRAIHQTTGRTFVERASDRGVSLKVQKNTSVANKPKAKGAASKKSKG